MAQQIINTGAVANDGTGDPLRTAFTETNNNFTEIYTAGPVDSNVRIVDNTILTLNTNGNLVLAPNGTGKLVANVDIVPNQANVRNLGGSARRWSTLYLQYADISNTVTVGGGLTVGGNLTVSGNIIQVGNIITDSLTIQLGNTAANAAAANGAGVTVGANDNIATLLYNSTSNVWTTNIGLSAVGNISGANIRTTGTVSATGNVTGNYFVGNGSQLTGITSSYGNPNVATLLAAFGSNTIVTTGNITGGNLLASSAVITTNFQGGNLQVTGNANASYVYAQGYISTAGYISATGNVTAGNVLTSAEVIASGVIQTGTGFSTGGYLSVNGSTDLHDTNIIGNLSVNTIRSDDSTVVKIQDGVEVDGDAVVNGNVTGAYILGNGSQLTGLPAIYGNANVTALLSNLGSNVISGTGNITTTANVSGAYVKGNGSALTNLPAPTVTQDITSTGAMSIMTYDGVIKYVNYATVEPASGNIAGGNILTGGLISATGNITAGNVNTGTITFTNGAVIRDTAGDAIAIGQSTGLSAQGDQAVAIGYGTGISSQGAGAVAISGGAGAQSQGFNAVAIGMNSGYASQGQYSVAIGRDAGSNVQGANSIAIGNSAGYNNQGVYAIAIGTQAGYTSQGNNSIILNATAANLNQTTANTFTVAPVRNDVANTAQVMFYNTTSKEVTYGNVISVAGNITGGNLITAGTGGAITMTGGNITGAGNISATGNITAGNVSTGTITLTNGAVIRDTAGESVAFGQGAGNTTQGQQAVAIGLQSGFASQGNYAVAIGKFSANSSQGEYAVAVGPNAGFENQSSNAVSIGSTAGASSQGINSVAIGVGAAYNTQGNSAVAVGNSAGYLLQGINSVSIGNQAGFAFQGVNSIAIGRLAGNTSQGNNSIILNATGAVLDQTTANTFTVAPVRNDVANTGQVVFYNTSSKEVTYGNTISVAGNITGGNVLTAGIVSATGNVTAANFFGNGNTLSNVATQVTGSWTVPVGNNTQSFTVPINNTYQLWVLGNIPNGIIVYNATVSVSNTNVPVVGQQFAWNYEGGGNILMFTSIPAQIVGTAGTISNAAPAVANTNVFSFGINNTSGNTVTVNYGYTKIS